jgi:hypothetical protein
VIGTVATAAFAVGTLAGCERPVPEVGAFSSGEFVQASASLWCFEGEAYTAPGACRETKESPALVKTQQGAAVAIEVPKVVKERGWFVRVVRGDEVVPGPIQKNKSFFRLAAEFPQGGSTMRIQVVALPQGANQGETSGVWEFSLVNAG